MSTARTDPDHSLGSACVRVRLFFFFFFFFFFVLLFFVSVFFIH